MTEHADVEKALIPAMAAWSGHRVVTDLPGDLEAHLPLHQVGKTTGSGVAPGFDYAELDVETYGGDRVEAVAAAEHIRWYLTREAVGVALSPTITITRVRCDRTPTVALYENPQLRRVVATYGLWIRHTV